MINRLQKAELSMQINTSFIAAANAKAITPGPTQSAPMKSPSQAEFAATEALDQALQNAPDIRPEKVEQATRLMDDRNYPPPELIRRLSRLFADNIESNTGLE